MKRFIIPLVCLLAVCCGKDKINSKPQTYKDVVAVELLPKPNEATLVIGQTFQIRWIVHPEDGHVNDTWWTTYKSDVITVDDNGLVTAVGLGDDRVFMRVLPSNFGEHYQFHVVPNPVPLQNLSLSPYDLEVGVGASKALELVCSPSTTTQRDFTWTSDKESVAKVDDTGKVTGVKVGTATITVSENGSGLSASVDVSVVQPFTSLEVAYPSKKFFTVESHDGKSCYAIVAGRPYNIVCNTKPSNATDKLIYTVESGKDQYLTVTSEGEMWGSKYGGPVAVTVNSRLNESLSSTFYVFVYDEPTGVELVGRNFEGIGPNCTQTWTVRPTPSTAFPYFSYGKPTADDDLTVSQSGTTITVKAAALEDSKLSTSSARRYREITLNYADLATKVRFMLCKYDPFQCKIGDGLVIKDGALCCYDGGNRGFGVVEASAYNNSSEPPFAIIAYIGEEQLLDPFLHLTSKKMDIPSFGATKMITGTGVTKKLESKVHGIAVPYNESSFYRMTSLNGWSGTGEGEQYMATQKWLYRDTKMPHGLTGNILLDNPGDMKHSAYINTMAYLIYNARVTDKQYQICPAIYVDCGIIIKDYNAVTGDGMGNAYTNYYIGTQNNYYRLNNVCPGVSDAGYYTTPWLLPTVKDMFTAFGLYADTFTDRHSIYDKNIGYVKSALENSVKQFTGKTRYYSGNYWTSNEASESSAWAVNIGSGDLAALSASKSSTYKILPVLYF